MIIEYPHFRAAAQPRAAAQRRSGAAARRPEACVLALLLKAVTQHVRSCDLEHILRLRLAASAPCAPRPPIPEPWCN